MTPERWQHVEQIFQAALERPPQERAGFCAAACLEMKELKRKPALNRAYGASGDCRRQRL
jgi:hypothetical protein